MNRTTQNLVAGMAGAAALTLLHQTLSRSTKDAPRLDMLAEEAVTKGIKKAGADAPSYETLSGLSLAGDIALNAGYYRMIGQGGDEGLLQRGITYGIVAGIGAITLPTQMGLNDAAVARTTKTKILTVGLYILGGIATALSLKALRK